MKTNFEQALAIAEGIARRKSAELTALTFHPEPNNFWVAYFGTPKGTSHVEIEDGVHLQRHFDDYEENFNAAGSPAREVLETDGERLMIEIGKDLVIVTRRNLGPYDDSDVGVQVDIMAQSKERMIYYVNTGAVILGGTATFCTYNQDDIEEP